MVKVFGLELHPPSSPRVVSRSSTVLFKDTGGGGWVGPSSRATLLSAVFACEGPEAKANSLLARPFPMISKSVVLLPVFLPRSPPCSHCCYASPPIPILLVLQPLPRSLARSARRRTAPLTEALVVGEDRRLVLPCLMSLTFLLFRFRWFLHSRSL